MTTPACSIDATAVSPSRCGESGGQLTLPFLRQGEMASGPRSLMKLADVMAYTQLSLRKIQQEMAAGAIAFIKIGRATRFRIEDVDDFLEARRIARRKKI